MTRDAKERRELLGTEDERKVEQQAEAQRVRQVAEQHRRSDLHRGEPGRRIHAVADRSAAQHRLPDRMPQRKGDQCGDHRSRTTDPVLDVAHYDDLVERQRQQHAGSAGDGKRERADRDATHVVEHLGDADALERPEQHVGRERRDEQARADADGGLDPVSAWVGHRWILEGSVHGQRTNWDDNDSH